jgi:beta-glucosidase
MNESIPYFADWPRIDSAITQDPVIEREISQILSQMTLEEKVGQMIQPNLRGVTPELAKKYKLGSILNGGGTWINENKYATAEQWADKADEFWQALEDAYADRPFRIPFMWATDAVHGHNNVYDATLFPHNIGLGCTRDPDLIERIGEITAIEIAATGLDWTFAPTVAAPRDLRWGRTYEGYSEDSAITYHYAARMVKGLQGDGKSLRSDQKVISNVKHWLGDGGTYQGVDRGNNDYSEDLLRNLHAGGYFSGLNAGAQVVMSSFNTWVDDANYDLSVSDGVSYNHKIHGSKYLLTDVLKMQMGFDGLIVTDWNGHAEVSKCTDDDATYCINAGNDILMITDQEHWVAAFEKTIADVESGAIPMARINDAVLRILRVKKRAGLWEKARPNKRSLSGIQNLIGAPEHRLVAREAVRKSLVLLKNNHNLLPLSLSQKVLLTGSAADDLTKQAGGWNLTWQGDENLASDFPNAVTVRGALEKELGSSNVIYDADLSSDFSDAKVAIVAFGEDPYAEMIGDIKPGHSLEFSTIKRRYAHDCDKITRLKEAGIKVIALFFSGRPLYMNQQINQCDAFVAAFLPGSEGLGVTDVLLRDEEGNIKHDFVGSLSFSWPNRPDSYAVHRLLPHIENYQIHANEQDPRGEHAPLFEYGYGLSYANPSERDLDHLVLTEFEHDDSLSSEMHLFGVASVAGEFEMVVKDGHQQHHVSRNNPQQFDGLSTQPYNCLQQQDSILCEFENSDSSLEIITADGDSQSLMTWIVEGQLCFDVKVYRAATHPVWLSMGEASTPIDISSQLSEQTHDFHTLSFRVHDVISMSQSERTTLFKLHSEGTAQFVVANVRLEPLVKEE